MPQRLRGLQRVQVGAGKLTCHLAQLSGLSETEATQRTKKLLSAQRKVLAYVADKDDVSYISIPQKHLDLSFSTRLHGLGKKVLAHTVNKIDNLYLWLSQGADGFYTESMAPGAYSLQKKISENLQPIHPDAGEEEAAEGEEDGQAPAED